MLRHQFELRLTYDTIRKRLLSELIFIFVKVVQIGTGMEPVNMETEAIKTTENHSVDHIKPKGYGDASNCENFPSCKNTVWKRCEHTSKS